MPIMPIFHPRTEPGDPGSPKRNRCHVVVVHPLTLVTEGEIGWAEADMDAGPKFRVRFDDGVETDAFADELTPPPIHPQEAEYTAYRAAKPVGVPTHEYTFTVQVLHTVTVTAATMRDGRAAATEALAEVGTVECMDLELIDGEPF